jgi:CRISPR/Cas system-associated exonuclease Cas4 (RecB family)
VNVYQRVSQPISGRFGTCSAYFWGSKKFQTNPMSEFFPYGQSKKSQQKNYRKSWKAFENHEKAKNIIENHGKPRRVHKLFCWTCKLVNQDYRLNNLNRANKLQVGVNHL